MPVSSSIPLRRRGCANCGEAAHRRRKSAAQQRIRLPVQTRPKAKKRRCEDSRDTSDAARPHTVSKSQPLCRAPGNKARRFPVSSVPIPSSLERLLTPFPPLQRLAVTSQNRPRCRTSPSHSRPSGAWELFSRQRSGCAADRPSRISSSSFGRKLTNTLTTRRPLSIAHCRSSVWALAFSAYNSGDAFGPPLGRTTMWLWCACRPRRG